MEETGIYLLQSNFEIVDSFIYPERKIKTFIFNVSLEHYHLSQIKNTEPKKHTHWQWFTKKEALKLNLIPSVRCYLENCC